MDNPYRRIEASKPATIGWRVHYFAELSSTQDVGAELAIQGAEHGAVVIAEAQTAGRGRLGRSWVSPPGVNLYATVILRPAIAFADVALVSLVAGVAAAEALETVALGLPRLKWPNDIWIRGRKTGGILAQLAATPGDQRPCVLLGIGLNLNLRREQISEPLAAQATSVLIETGMVCDRVALAKTLFARLDTRLAELEQHGFEGPARVWEHYSMLTGRRVTVLQAGEDGERRSGVVTGIDHAGALMLATPQGSIRILSGDVSIERIE